MIDLRRLGIAKDTSSASLLSLHCVLPIDACMTGNAALDTIRCVVVAFLSRLEPSHANRLCYSKCNVILARCYTPSPPPNGGSVFASGHQSRQCRLRWRTADLGRINERSSELSVVNAGYKMNWLLHCWTVKTRGARTSASTSAP